uniref:Uncharacterized protein n=1 Tax=Meloidogyne enterolobii TaxID=390850 RepID=A0A6V7VND3_MELEN|nr:unnamed protein product [Meloidogyne enterolobii]
MDCVPLPEQVEKINGHSHSEIEVDDVHIYFQEYARLIELPDYFPEDLRHKIKENSHNIEGGFQKKLQTALENRDLYNFDERALIARELSAFDNLNILKKLRGRINEDIQSKDKCKEKDSITKVSKCIKSIKKF